ncbi:MAG: hypothetical protein MUF23_12110, partial [Pirellula sp.]|nr:hypothetical protein [Pirellula sp.]
MKWRARAGIAIAVLGFLALGSQPVARWIVSSTLSRFVPGGLAIEGAVRWDPIQQAWSCSQLRFHSDSGQTWRAERMTVRLDSKEFLRRNLVVDSARIDGITIETDDRRFVTEDELVHPVEIPCFSVDSWLHSVLIRHKNEILSASQSREFRRRELQQQWKHLRDRCESIQLAVDSHPLRGQQPAIEARQEIVSLMQSIAEERIRVRELNQRFASFSDQWRQEWRDEISEAIVRSLPDPNTSAHLIVKNSIVQHWMSHRDFISVASTSARPIHEIASKARGTDIELPGVSRNYLLVRNASLVGHLEPNRGDKVRFRANLVDLGDSASRFVPKSGWRFEPAIGSGITVDVSVEGPGNRSEIKQAGSREYQVVSWGRTADSETSSRAIWIRDNDMEKVELVCPIGILANQQPLLQEPLFQGGQSPIAADWQGCWDRAVRNRRGQCIAACWWVETASSGPARDPWQCQNMEVHPNTINLSKEIWNDTQTEYLE